MSREFLVDGSNGPVYLSETGSSSVLVGTTYVALNGAVNASVALLGVSSSTGIGNANAIGSAQTALTGASRTTGAGTLLAQGTANVLVRGTSAISKRGLPLADNGDVFVVDDARANLIYQLCLLHGLDTSNPLRLTSNSRTAGALTQSVTSLGDLLIHTNTAPALSGNLDDWVDALAALHGLTAPLVVTPTSRDAGVISQLISTAGGAITITRQ